MPANNALVIHCYQSILPKQPNARIFNTMKKFFHDILHEQTILRGITYWKNLKATIFPCSSKASFNCSSVTLGLNKSKNNDINNIN